MAKKSYHKITGNESVGVIAKRYGTTPQAILNENPGVGTLSAGAYLRVPKTKGQAGFYQTGEGERKDDLFIDGKRVRMGPNSTITPNRPETLLGRIQGFAKGLLQGFNEAGPGESAGVRGAVPPSGGGKNARVVRQGGGFGEAGGGINQNYIEGGYQAPPEPPFQMQGGWFGNPDNQPPQKRPPRTGDEYYPNESIGARVGSSVYNGWKPSKQVEGWLQNVSSGNPTPVSANMFNDLTLVTQLSGVPRDASILYADSQLKGMGYVYNPTTKRYEQGTQPEEQKPVSQMTQAEQSALYQSGRNERTGSSSIKGTSRYGQQSFYKNGKLVTRDTRNIRSSGGQSQVYTPPTPSDNSNTVSGQGAAQSIWRIG